MTIDDAMSALLKVGGQQFKKNVELYGAVHTDELRYPLSWTHLEVTSGRSGTYLGASTFMLSNLACLSVLTNGCTFHDQPLHVVLQPTANVSLTSQQLQLTRHLLVFLQ